MAIAFFHTWTTYGTWLPGDARGFRKRLRGEIGPIPRWEFEAKLRMNETAILLDQPQRELVENTVAAHCGHRGWILHTVNCRSNHVHAIVSADVGEIELPRREFKAWCTRRLKERQRQIEPESLVRESWWSDRGWDVFLDNDDDLADAMKYVLEEQDSVHRWTEPPRTLACASG